MSYERHDEALGLLIDYGPDLKNGMTSHVPMVAESLAAMGRGAEAVEWVRRHRHTIVPRKREYLPIDADKWSDALGVHARNEAWSAFFAREIRAHGWRQVCHAWVPRLAPGFAAAATHGVIRTAHAARALSQHETDLRLRELADGLALWASTYQTLPTAPGPSRELSSADALTQVPLVPMEMRRNGGSITAALGQLKHATGFDSAINFVTLGSDLDVRVLDAAESFAQVLVANVRTSLTAIVFTHGVTGLLAVRNLLPFVSVEAGQELLKHGWHTSAALYSAYAHVGFAGTADCGKVVEVDRVARAVVHGDDHVIKLTEACLTFYAMRPAKVFLKATDLAAQHLDAEAVH